MKTYAIHKSAMIAPRKARMTLDLIRGKDVATAEAILDTTNTKGSRLIKKVLKSAINPGPVYKRIKFASRGNVDRRDKRTSHIYVEVSDGKSEGGNK